MLRDIEPHGRRPATATRMETRRRVQDVEGEATSGVREEEEGCRMPPIRLAEAIDSREDERRVARVRVPSSAVAASGRGRVDRRGDASEERRNDLGFRVQRRLGYI
jgi:hypothetical protein